ncbi:MAG: outer membrane protein assembly factor BamD [Bacteroidota bacterium]
MRKLAFPVVILLVLILGVSQSGCDPYKKMAKSDKIADKDSAAVHYYKEKKYDRAVYLFEELLAIYRGTSRMEEMYYYYTYCRYFLGELVSASYYFEDYGKRFPNSKHVEEFQYMTAKCYHLLSDPHQLDQKYSYKAISQYQLFLSRYPYTDKKDKCMEGIKELRERLAKKSFEQANLYYKIGFFKAAVEAFQIMINEYPDSDLREEGQYLLFRSAVRLAQASINARKIERYEEALQLHEKFAVKFPDSKFANDAETVKSTATRSLERLIADRNEKEQVGLYDEFETAMNVVLKSEDLDERQKQYAKALDTYKELKDKYPESKFLSDADKLFEEVEAKQDQN